MSSANEPSRWEQASETATAVRDRLPLTDSLLIWGVFVALVLGLLVRLVFLGDRIAHFDEGRVAYWALYTFDTGHFAYRRIIHGPLLQHMDRWLFGILGTSDFVMRLPVALIGAALPASAVLFRKHLHTREVVALAFLLALNPVLLYYSRFMRSDMLVGTFMFVALGLFVRYYDTRQRRYVYAATAFVVLGFGSKENALVYVLTWLGAAALLADQALFRPRNYDSGGHLLWTKGVASYRHLREDRFQPWRENLDIALDRLKRRFHVALNWVKRRLDATLEWLGVREGRSGPDAASVDTRGQGPSTWTAALRALAPLRFVGYALVILLVAATLFLFIYAPRGAGLAGLRYPIGDPAAHVGLWDAVVNPAQLPGLFVDTLQYVYDEFVRWFSATSEPGCNKDNVIDGWLCYAGRYVEVMAYYAGPLTGFAILGIVAERYGARTTRNLVLFVAYGGIVSIVGYPLGTDVWGAWIVPHALIPLSIPAAVGVGVLLRWGQEAFEARDTIGVVIAVALLLLSAGVGGFVMVDSVYTNETAADNQLVQYAQPQVETKPAVLAMERAAAANDGTDVVLYYGESGTDFDGRESIIKENWEGSRGGHLAQEPLCSSWFGGGVLPLPWYFARADADVTCERDPAALQNSIENDSVPVVIAPAGDTTLPRDTLEASYVNRTYRLRTTDSNLNYYVAPEYADDLPPGNDVEP